MYCFKCGKKVEAKSKFCQYCGTEQPSKTIAQEKKFNPRDYKKRENKNPMLTIPGVITFVIVMIFVWWLLKDEGILGAMISGAAAGSAAWLITSFRIQATQVPLRKEKTKVENDTKENEGK